MEARNISHARLLLARAEIVLKAEAQSITT